MQVSLPNRWNSRPCKNCEALQHQEVFWNRKRDSNVIKRKTSNSCVPQPRTRKQLPSNCLLEQTGPNKNGGHNRLLCDHVKEIEHVSDVANHSCKQNIFKVPSKLYALLILCRWYTHVHRNWSLRISTPFNFPYREICKSAFDDLNLHYL